MVVLTVPDAAARAHALDLTRADRGAMAQAVLVTQTATEHHADDLHVAVSMRAKARAWRHAVFVDDPQVAPAHEAWVLVTRKRKAVEAAQPAVIGVTALE
jgi:hypothetical protein